MTSGGVANCEALCRCQQLGGGRAEKPHRIGEGNTDQWCGVGRERWRWIEVRAAGVRPHDQCITLVPLRGQHLGSREMVRTYDGP